MSVSKLGNTNTTLSQRLRMLADEWDTLEANDKDRTEFLLITMETSGTLGCGGYIVDILSATGALEIAKIDLIDSYNSSIDMMH